MTKAKRVDEHLSSIIAAVKHDAEWKDGAINAAHLLAISVRKYHHCQCDWASVIRALRRWQRSVGVKQTPIPDAGRPFRRIE